MFAVIHLFESSKVPFHIQIQIQVHIKYISNTYPIIRAATRAAAADVVTILV